ncbi:hypothetical protein DACRYDRAFT_93209, partial [Dacryopinax primogenitus]
MTDEERAKQAAKEARAAEREAREAEELARQPKAATGMCLFSASTSTPGQPASAPAANGIQLPSLPGAGGSLGTTNAGLGLLGSQTQANQSATPKPTLSLFSGAPDPLNAAANTATTQPAAGGLSVLGAAGNAQRPTLGSMPALGPTTQSNNPPAAPTAPTANRFGAFQFPKPAATTSTAGQAPTSMFNRTTMAPASQTPSLFPQPATTQPQSTSLFGAPAATSAFGQRAASGSTSFFGQLQQQQPQQTSVFGQPSGAFGASTGGTLGLSQLTQSMRAPPQQLGTAAPPPLQAQTVTKAARYDDLSEADKMVVKEIDEHIRACMDVAKELKASTLGEDINSLSQSIKRVQIDATIVKDNYAVAEVVTRQVQTQMDSDLKDATAAVGIIDKFNANPKQPGHAPWQSEYPVKYFARTEAQMRSRLHSAKNTMQQIESLLRDSYRHEQRSAKEISNAMGNQTDALLALAGQTADLDAKAQQLKGDYTRLYRAKTGSSRDPFVDVPGRPVGPA